MSKNNLKAALALVGTVLVPMVAQADQSMSSNQNGDQTNQQTYVPGEIVKAGQLPAGYSASATYRCMDGWDVFVTGDYIYWAWEQDSFKYSDVVPLTAAVGATESIIYNDPGYTSGFQVGLGFNMPGMDDWNLYAEYTWYRNSNTNSVSNDSSHALLPHHFDHYVKGTATSEVKMHFDALDFLLKRPFYFGKKLTANFAAGLSALWITQNFDTSSSGLRGTSLSSITTAFSHSKAKELTSWGLGPKFGLETNWMLGYGMQIMANLSASMLYTRYEMNASSSTTASGVTSTLSSHPLDGYGTVRPVTEAFLGLGWGTGFFDDNYHIAFSIGYDFKGYWFYNMRDYVEHDVGGNMYLQGMNIGARFDF